MTLPTRSFLNLNIPMARRVAEHDWSCTPLGPIDEWPAALKIAVALTLGSGFAKCLCWGPQHIAIYNDAFQPILADKGDCLGLPFSLIWEESWPAIGPIAAKALAGESTFIKDFPLKVRRDASGLQEAFFTFSYSPVTDENGAVLGFMDTVIETTDRVRFERKAAVSNRELVHRMKNSYALVTAIVRQIARRATSVEDLRDRLVTRLADMGHAQEILSLRVDMQASVDEVVAHLRDRMDGLGTRFEISGPRIALSDNETFALTLALYELATNSTKYGALSTDTGRILIHWSVEEDGHEKRFVFCWREVGGPPVETPKAYGFGSFLVKQLLAAEFGGEMSVQYPPEGVICQLTARRAG
ncbi:sensor histidine kinase [Falsirhodobacter sp. 20TX0035]|uniref:sensor histidine kinase n=1 Tax=Falsirhodobacter sp. 20TX0035 TaxID=3022019 RepID=UPI002330B788|nr:sensor histidine kinase [Falsirhodobacter sp. 20TX0035]MDB6453754.1 sensor histidine kinase [Falsirhodobacter sp. 20TX0035]